MNRMIKKAVLLGLILSATILVLGGCDNPAAGDATEDDNDTTQADGGDDATEDNNDTTTEFYVITEDNMETLKTRITNLMSHNQASIFATRNELDPIFLAALLKDHLGYIDAGTSNEDLTDDLCSAGGNVSLSSSGDTHTFTYNQCSEPDDFDSSDPFDRDGTIALTDTSDHWLVEIDLKYESTEHKGSLEFIYDTDSDYSMSSINLTRTPESETSNTVDLDDITIVYNVGGDDISITGNYGETARSEWATLESGKVQISSDNLDKFHDTSRGTVTLTGANNTQATIDFSSGDPVIELDT